LNFGIIFLHYQSKAFSLLNAEAHIGNGGKFTKAFAEVVDDQSIRPCLSCENRNLSALKTFRNVNYLANSSAETVEV